VRIRCLARSAGRLNNFSFVFFQNRKLSAAVHNAEEGPQWFPRGGKERLCRVSRAGPVDIRKLLIIGAMTRVRWASRKPPVQGAWLSRMLGKKSRMLMAIALANKMARTVWAMLMKQKDYRNPAVAVQ